MLNKEITNWGVGPRWTLWSVLYAVLAFTLHFTLYPFFFIEGIPFVATVAVGVVLIAIGISIWIVAGTRIDPAIEKGLLATQGLYNVMRHPIYAQAILFTVPGILLPFRSWLLLTIPIFMYLVFKALIGEEDNFLEAKFGDEYLRYRSEVNEIFPTVSRLSRAYFYPVATGQIAEDLFAVQDGDVNLFVYTNGSDTICIDAGYGSDSIVGDLESANIDPDSISHLFLTHTDKDHASGLRFFEHSRVYLGSDDEQMIDGSTARVLWVYHSPRLPGEYTLLSDGDVVQIGSISVKAIATPGHTPGHMAYLIDDHILFTGDALVLQNGVLYPFYRPFNMNPKAARESVGKLARFKGISMLCTAHTGCAADYEELMIEWKERP